MKIRKMYEFIYCFARDNRINYSGENSESVLTWIKEEEMEKVQKFIETSKVGEFISLKNGSVIFHCYPTNTITYPDPIPLIEVLNNTRLL